MKKITLIILVFLIISALSCSSRKKYSDIREFISEVVATQDEFLALIEKSAKPEDAVYAVEVFGDKLIRLSEKSLVIKKNYPEIEKWVDNPPADLKTDLARLENTQGKFEEVFLKENVKNIVKDRKVQDAFIELNKKMESVKFFQ